jgi:hypothetical protein
LQGPTWVTGHDGSALQFDGSSQYLQRADLDLAGLFPNKSSNGATAFTFTARVKLDQLGLFHPILTKQGSGTRGLLWAVEEDNRLRVELFKDQDTGTSIKSSAPLQADNWYHVAVSYEFIADGSSRIRLYIDGQLEGSTDNAVGPPVPNSIPFDVGRYYWSGSYERYLDGAIDELALFGRVLSQPEVGSIAQNGVSGGIDFETWSAAWGISEPHSDDDGDRMTALVEFLFDLNPLAHEPIPTTIGPFGMRFPISRAVAGVVVEVQQSADLVRWQPYGGALAVAAQSAEATEYEVEWPASPQGRIFLRLSVQLDP